MDRARAFPHHPRYPSQNFTSASKSGNAAGLFLPDANREGWEVGFRPKLGGRSSRGGGRCLELRAASGMMFSFDQITALLSGHPYVALLPLAVVEGPVVTFACGVLISI